MVFYTFWSCGTIIDAEKSVDMMDFVWRQIQCLVRSFKKITLWHYLVFVTLTKRRNQRDAKREAPINVSLERELSALVTAVFLIDSSH